MSNQNLDSVFINGPSTRYVKLNVGGCFFQTTLGTLRKYDCMLKTMFSGGIPVRQDEEGFVIIDRSGKHFEKILNFLRDDFVPLPECRVESFEILHEAKYYLLQELVLHCVSWLQLINKIDNAFIDFPKISIIQTEKSVDCILKSFPDQLVIEFLMNRQNNNYSYTPQSNENFIKNQEIFDKLALRMKNRVTFVKNIGLDSTEICCWNFYSHDGKKKIICCTSILYSSDCKQTKVDFPEARIYEEAMNILLSHDISNTTKLQQQRNKFPHNCLKCQNSDITKDVSDLSTTVLKKNIISSETLQSDLNMSNYSAEMVKATVSGGYEFNLNLLSSTLNESNLTNE